jgi:hypothetical protein
MRQASIGTRGGPQNDDTMSITPLPGISSHTRTAISLYYFGLGAKTGSYVPSPLFKDMYLYMYMSS